MAAIDHDTGSVDFRQIQSAEELEQALIHITHHFHHSLEADGLDHDKATENAENAAKMAWSVGATMARLIIEKKMDMPQAADGMEMEI